MFWEVGRVELENEPLASVSAIPLTQAVDMLSLNEYVPLANDVCVGIQNLMLFTSVVPFSASTYGTTAKVAEDVLEDVLFRPPMSRKPVALASAFCVQLPADSRCLDPDGVAESTANTLNLIVGADILAS